MFYWTFDLRIPLNWFIDSMIGIRLCKRVVDIQIISRMLLKIPKSFDNNFVHCHEHLRMCIKLQRTHKKVFALCKCNCNRFCFHFLTDESDIYIQLSKGSVKNYYFNLEVRNCRFIFSKSKLKMGQRRHIDLKLIRFIIQFLIQVFFSKACSDLLVDFNVMYMYFNLAQNLKLQWRLRYRFKILHQNGVHSLKL